MIQTIPPKAQDSKPLETFFYAGPYHAIVLPNGYILRRGQIQSLPSTQNHIQGMIKMNAPAQRAQHFVSLRRERGTVLLDLTITPIAKT